ncbi:hypothetical protein L218DRAFT_127923 [Marasmius fiardii PR-910]|nr:hypothetical protein L218DRAFT_127923 [Marasmius fiardii PR-910]
MAFPKATIAIIALGTILFLILFLTGLTWKRSRNTWQSGSVRPQASIVYVDPIEVDELCLNHSRPSMYSAYLALEPIAAPKGWKNISAKSTPLSVVEMQPRSCSLNSKFPHRMTVQIFIAMPTANQGRKESLRDREVCFGSCLKKVDR